jgi:ubiquinone/menaquinone biosynthesis C-methylase UbiE
MEAKSIDPTEFREGQRKQWNTAASGWWKWSELIDAELGFVSERLVELAEVKPGNRVLDVACGYGEPAMSAARTVGPEGRVTATDIAPAMIEFARERAERERMENMDFIVSEAMALDFPPGSFDAALSRFGIIFDPDGEGAAARVRGFLVPGGRMAISSWGKPEEVPFLLVPMRTVMQRLQVQPPPPGTPGPLSRPTPEALAGLLEGGGFSDVEVERTEVTFQWPSAEEFTTFVKEIAPPISAMMASHPPETQAETWSAITEAVQEHAADDGTVSFTNVVLMAAGRA